MALTNRLMDTVYAYNFLKILTTDWKDFPAYKLGIIDDNGTIIKPYRKLSTAEEKSAYTMFDRLVWNLKKFISKLPGGKTKVGSYAAAFAFLKEELDKSDYSNKRKAILTEQFKQYAEKELT